MEIPKKIIDHVKEGDLAFFVGSGISKNAGLPTWDELLDELIDFAYKKNRASDEQVKEYKESLKNKDHFFFIAEDLKQILETQYYEFMHEKFADKKLQPTENHKLIVRTNASLAITINYDNLLEKAYIQEFGDQPNSFTYSEPKLAANNFWRGEFFILKAHGDAKKAPETLILSQKDYRSTLYDQHGYKSLLQTIFTTKPILFLGVSMNDPEFKQLLDYLHHSFHGGGPKHYLLTEEGNTNTSIIKRYEEDFNIETIPYSNQAGDHQEVNNFLKELQNYS